MGSSVSPMALIIGSGFMPGGSEGGALNNGTLSQSNDARNATQPNPWPTSRTIDGALDNQEPFPGEYSPGGRSIPGSEFRDDLSVVP